MVSQRIWPRSAGLHRITPVLEFLNREPEGNGEALIFKTNDFGIHRKAQCRQLPAPRFVSRHCCFVPPCCRVSLHVPGAVGGRTGRLQMCGSSRSSVALLLPELLVFTFQHVKNGWPSCSPYALQDPARLPSTDRFMGHLPPGDSGEARPQLRAVLAFPEATSLSYLCGVLECMRSCWTAESLVVMDVFPS